LAANLPLTLANHAEGLHAFDLFDDRAATRAAVGQVLGFLQAWLRPRGAEPEARAPGGTAQYDFGTER
jgi:hypothetical protein